MKVQVSPRLGWPSSPSEQSIPPLSGAVSGGHAVTKNLQNEKCPIRFLQCTLNIFAIIIKRVSRHTKITEPSGLVIPAKAYVRLILGQYLFAINPFNDL